MSPEMLLPGGAWSLQRALSGRLPGRARKEWLGSLPGGRMVFEEVPLMKRVLKIWIAICGINMFFTGCNSLMVKSEWNPEQVMESVAVQETISEAGIRLRYSDEEREKNMEDFYEGNLSRKFQELEGIRAFRLGDGHSEASEDMENFQIERLMADGTFYYSYSTRVKGTGENRKKLHCAAAYNYRTEELQIFHENRFDSTDEDRESFMMQMSPVNGGGWEIFVYDNGVGSIYDAQGSLMFRADIESFVRACYSQAHSVMITNAVIDGGNRIYLELVVEKEPVEISENPEAENEPIDDDQAEKEAEEAEAEMEDKVESQVLVYDFIPLKTTINQYKDSFEEQKKAWIHKTEGKTFSSEPDVEKDWKDVTEKIPDKWGTGYLPGYGNRNVMAWKEGIRFQAGQDGVSSRFQPMAGSYEGFTNVKPDTVVSNLFVMDGNYWYGLTGIVGNSQEAYDPETITRTYTYEVTTTSTDSEGNAHTVTFTEDREQKIQVYRRRKTEMRNVQLEGYWVIDKVHSLGGCMDGRVLGASDEKIFWLEQDRSLKSAGKIMEEGMTAGMFEDGDTRYLVQYNGSRMVIAQGDDWDKAPVRWEIPYEKLTSRYRAGDSAHDQAFEELNQEYLGSANVYSNADFYTEKGVLRAELDYDGKRDGFLLTSMNKGLVYYEPASETAVLVGDGSWYGSWKQGNKFLSVGFSRGDSSYESMDVVFARVYEYDLKELFKEALRMAERQEEERKERNRRLSEGETETSAENEEESGEGLLEIEGLKPMEDTWNKEYKEKWQDVDLKEAGRQGETFDAEEYSREQKENQEGIEASQKARIEQIIGGISQGGEEGEGGS